MGEYYVRKFDVEDIIKDFGIYFENIYNILPQYNQEIAWKDAARFMLYRIEGIDSVRRCADVDRSQYIPTSLPNQLVNIC